MNRCRSFRGTVPSNIGSTKTVLVHKVFGKNGSTKANNGKKKLGFRLAHATSTPVGGAIFVPGDGGGENQWSCLGWVHACATGSACSGLARISPGLTGGDRNAALLWAPKGSLGPYSHRRSSREVEAAGTRTVTKVLPTARSKFAREKEVRILNEATRRRSRIGRGTECTGKGDTGFAVSLSRPEDRPARGQQKTRLGGPAGERWAAPLTSDEKTGLYRRNRGLRSLTKFRPKGRARADFLVAGPRSTSGEGVFKTAVWPAGPARRSSSRSLMIAAFESLTVPNRRAASRRRGRLRRARPTARFSPRSTWDCSLQTPPMVSRSSEGGQAGLGV